MRRVKLCVATSLDGYIAGPNEEIDWLFGDQDYGLAAFFTTVDTVLIGRKSHDFMLRRGEQSYKGLKNYVFSRSPAKREHPQVNWVSGDPAPVVGSLRRGEGKDIWLFGGGLLFVSLLERDLVDDVILAVHPIILGEGIPLYPGPFKTVRLELVEVEPFDTGLVILRYRVQRDDSG